MWETGKAWGLPLRYTEVVTAYKQCLVVLRDNHIPHSRDSRKIHQGGTPLSQWQVDYTGPLPHSKGSQFALIFMDTTTGTLQAYPSGKANQRANIRGSSNCMPHMGPQNSLRVIRALSSLDTYYKNGLKLSTLTGISNSHTTQRGLYLKNVTTTS